MARKGSSSAFPLESVMPMPSNHLPFEFASPLPAQAIPQPQAFDQTHIQTETQIQEAWLLLTLEAVRLYEHSDPALAGLSNLAVATFF